MQIEVGNILTLKKKHPCGSFEWKVLRVGQDFRIECMECGHHIMITRTNLEKKIRQIR